MRVPRSAKSNKAIAMPGAGDGGEIARGKGTQALLRVTAVGFDIEQIVDNVSRRGRETETEKSQQRVQQAPRGRYVRQQKRQKDEQILCPLMRAQGPEGRREPTAAFHEGARGTNAAEVHPEAQAKAGIGHHGFGGVGQQRQIGSVIADVRVGAGELGAEPIELAGSSQVDLAVAGENAAKDAEMRRDAFGQPEVGSGDEVEGTAAQPLLM